MGTCPYYTPDPADSPFVGQNTGILLAILMACNVRRPDGSLLTNDEKADRIADQFGAELVAWAIRGGAPC